MDNTIIIINVITSITIIPILADLALDIVSTVLSVKYIPDIVDNIKDVIVAPRNTNAQTIITTSSYIFKYTTYNNLRKMYIHRM